jgi:hypothetical protein
MLGVRVSRLFFLSKKGAIAYEICFWLTVVAEPISSMTLNAAVSLSNIPSTYSLIRKSSFSEAIYFTVKSWDFWSSEIVY